MFTTMLYTWHLLGQEGSPAQSIDRTEDKIPTDKISSSCNGALSWMFLILFCREQCSIHTHLCTHKQTHTLGWGVNTHSEHTHRLRSEWMSYFSVDYSVTWQRVRAKKRGHFSKKLKKGGNFTFLPHFLHNLLACINHQSAPVAL